MFEVGLARKFGFNFNRCDWRNGCTNVPILWLEWAFGSRRSICMECYKKHEHDIYSPKYRLTKTQAMMRMAIE